MALRARRAYLPSDPPSGTVVRVRQPAKRNPVSGVSNFTIPVNTLPYRMAGTRDSHNIALGRAIKQLRKGAGLTQRQLAERAEVTVKELSMIENGLVNADWGTVRHLAYGMQAKLADVFRLTEELEDA
jgi:DNA-binding XRE family transcriptional regulator